MIDFVRVDGRTLLTRLTDGRVMCAICMEYKSRGELQPVADEPGRLWDICSPCWASEHEVKTCAPLAQGQRGA